LFINGINFLNYNYFIRNKYKMSKKDTIDLEKNTLNATKNDFKIEKPDRYFSKHQKSNSDSEIGPKNQKNTSPYGI
jgi:hypothetical protein